jgi:hypothetical protein
VAAGLKIGKKGTFQELPQVLYALCASKWMCCQISYSKIWYCLFHYSETTCTCVASVETNGCAAGPKKATIAIMSFYSAIGMTEPYGKLSTLVELLVPALRTVHMHH